LQPITKGNEGNIIVQKSYGKMRGARKKLRKPVKPTINELLRSFAVGDKVHIVIRSSSPFQHPRFFGKTGTVVGKSGRSYVVEVKMGNMVKTLNLLPEHLKK
jgi:large subunit ribosomal protein L21e